MSHLVLKAICDADECEILGNIAYSTNPRKYVTLQQMLESYERTVSQYDY